MMCCAKIRKLAPLALIFAAGLLLSGCTSPDVCDSKGLVSGDFTALWSSWQGAIALGVLVIFLISGLVYVLSGLIAHRGLMVWSKNQIYEGFVTLVFAFFALMLVGFVCSMDVHVLDADCVPQDGFWKINPLYPAQAEWRFDAGTHWGSCNAFDVANYDLQRFRNQISNGFYIVLAINLVVAGLASTVISYSVTGMGPTMSIGQGLSNTSQQLSTAMIAIVSAQLITMTQLLLLQVSARLFGFLMPAGIILRSFGITRGFGGSLIAIALGFYLIYPLAVVLCYGMVLGTVDSDLAVMGGKDTVPDGVSGDWWNPVDKTCAFVGTLIVGAVLVPFIVFVIVIAFVKGVSGMIGEEVDVSNLTRLV